MLGALISAAAMTNVVVLDIAYDVGVKWLAGQILLMALFVTAPYAHELTDAVVRHVARRGPLFQNRRADRAVRVVGAVVGILMTIWGLPVCASHCC
jgi:MFS-type transporter involved in bile tolerance (Atg22 family)